MLVAAMYIVHHKEFNLTRYQTLTNDIKNKVGVFSYLKSLQRFTTAATLDITCQDPNQGFEKLMKIYEGLIESGFSRTPYAYIAAGTLLKVEDTMIHKFAKKSHDIYRGMKEHHYFLTGSADYPLATLLAQGNGDVAESIDRTEVYYELLKKKGFYKGHSLQFLSHILTLVNNPHPDDLVKKCLEVLEILKKKGIRVKRSYYPFVGILALLDQPDEQINLVLSLLQNLYVDKQFKWKKDINFMITVVLIIREKIDLGDIAIAGLNTSIEAIIQAQQAAMVASISANTASQAVGENKLILKQWISLFFMGKFKLFYWKSEVVHIYLG